MPSGLILNNEKWPAIVTRSFGCRALGAFGFWAVAWEPKTGLASDPGGHDEFG